jgi:hypothetical protein
MGKNERGYDRVSGDTVGTTSVSKGMGERQGMRCHQSSCWGKYCRGASFVFAEVCVCMCVCVWGGYFVALSFILH